MRVSPLPAGVPSHAPLVGEPPIPAVPALLPPLALPPWSPIASPPLPPLPPLLPTLVLPAVAPPSPPRLVDPARFPPSPASSFSPASPVPVPATLAPPMPVPPEVPAWPPPALALPGSVNDGDDCPQAQSKNTPTHHTRSA